MAESLDQRALAGVSCGRGDGIRVGFDEATRRERRKIIADQPELKKSSNTGSWGTSCLLPPFRLLGEMYYDVSREKA